jgi:hypothetical protein
MEARLERSDTAETPPAARKAGPLALSAGMCVILGLAIGAGGKTLAGRLRARSAPAESTDKAVHCRPGPWGMLTGTRIIIEPPVEFVPSEWASKPTRWFFGNQSRRQVEDLFAGAALTKAQRRSLLAATREESAGGVTVMPDRDLVLDLSPEARERIYTVLAAYPENTFHFQPFRYPADAVAEWFPDSSLRQQTKTLIKRLLYKRGTSMAFSDPEIVLNTLQSTEEKSVLFKTLARRPTLLVKLRLEPNTDIGAMAAYWGVGSRSKDIHSLLASLSRQPYAMDIPIVHLLPRIPRERLYTYPSSDPDSVETTYDCHWTSLNFLRRVPNDEFATNMQAVVNALENEFQPVQDNPVMGDILVFVTFDGKLVHSCVYVADDIVFTKNGRGWNTPWTLMMYKDVVSLYSAVFPITVRVYRTKAGEPAI